MSYGKVKKDGEEVIFVDYGLLERYFRFREERPDVAAYWMSLGIAPDDFIWDNNIEARLSEAFSRAEDKEEFRRNETITTEMLFTDGG